MVPNATTHEEGESLWFGPWDYTKGPLNKTVLLEWLDQGLDFFGCDENTPKKMFGDALRLQSSGAKTVDLHSLDYAKLHDEFLESLLYEQTQKPAPTMEELGNAAANLSLSASSSQSMYTSASASSFASGQTSSKGGGDDSFGSTKKQKRPRPLRLHRKVMPALPNGPENNKPNKSPSKSPIRSSHKLSNKLSSSKSTSNKSLSNKSSADAAVPVLLSELSRTHFPPPSIYIHPQCRMQKDKGKGEPVGSNICAKGRDACLEKLQQKMELLTRVAFGEEKKGSADMKRRPAKVAEFFPNFTETRSIIELRMGFLSMQYGILLRWDTSRTGKVALVVLRKMCHEKFYERCAKNPTRPPNKFFEPSFEPPAFAVRNVIDGNNVLLQRPDGMEVALLEPPYRVRRPDVFTPNALTVSLQYATGLTRKSTWTVQLCYDGKSENLALGWDKQQGCFVPKLDIPLKQEIPITSSLDLFTLDIRLYENRMRRKTRRRCVATMNVPLYGLEPHPTSRKALPSEMKVPCTHDSESMLTLSVLLESDYANWLRSELEARRREEVNNFVWKAPFRVVDVAYEEDNNDDEESVWEWICSVC